MGRRLAPPGAHANVPTPSGARNGAAGRAGRADRTHPGPPPAASRGAGPGVQEPTSERPRLLTHAFPTIGLIGKQGDPGVAGTAHALRDFLERNGRAVLLDEGLSDTEACGRAELVQRADLIVVIGGDGTLLGAARSLAGHDVPLVGVNLGRLGFLVDISPHEVTERIGEILDGRYIEERRFLLHMEVLRAGSVIMQSDALNDVVLHKGCVARMIEFDTQVDGRDLYTQRSDGLIVATPTGSTAYALSGGGPILHPSLDAIVLVPICPHTLSNRPIVVSADSKVRIIVRDGHALPAQITCDGQIGVDLQVGDEVLVQRRGHPVRLLHIEAHDYFDLLRAKLGWAHTPERR